MVIRNDVSSHYSFVPIAFVRDRRSMTDDRSTYYSNFDIEFYVQHLITGMFAYYQNEKLLGLRSRHLENNIRSLLYT